MVHTRKASYDTYGRLDDVECEAPEEFIRIHKSYLVNDLYVHRWNPDEAELVTGEVLRVSKSHKKMVREYFLKRRSL